MQITIEKIKTEESVWVVNTSILHLFDEYGALALTESKITKNARYLNE